MESSSQTTAQEKTVKDMYDGFLKKVKTEEGDVPFLKDLWNFFSQKGTKTVFVSVNPDKSFPIDLEVCESLGCPIQLITNSDQIEKKWQIISKTLKARAIDAEDQGHTWLNGIEKKWILTKNIKVTKDSLEWNTLSKKLNESTLERIDLLKIEGSSEEERVVLYSMLDKGYRPGIILVKYTFDPDSSVPSALMAGHLQMTGYRLMSCENNWFLYVFQDFCLYDSCSWRNTIVQNPVVASLFEVFEENQPKKEKNQSS